MFAFDQLPHHERSYECNMKRLLPHATSWTEAIGRSFLSSSSSAPSYTVVSFRYELHGMASIHHNVICNMQTHKRNELSTYQQRAKQMNKKKMHIRFVSEWSERMKSDGNDTTTQQSSDCTRVHLLVHIKKWIVLLWMTVDAQTKLIR